MALRRLRVAVPALIAAVLTLAACASTSAGTGQPTHAERADRFGVFARTAPEGGQVLIDDGRGGLQVESSCGTTYLGGTSVDAEFYPVSAAKPTLCLLDGTILRLDQPFGLARSGPGATLTVGPTQVAFSRPSDLTLPADFSDGSLLVTGSYPLTPKPGRTIEIQLGPGRLWGRTGCLGFEVPVERTGAFLTTGDARYSEPTCTGDEAVPAQVANRSLAALDGPKGPELIAGLFHGLALQPTGHQLDRPTGLTRTLHRDPAPVTGRFHATSYTVDGEVRSTLPQWPFRLTLSDDDNASWEPDCNEATANGWWTGTRFTATGVGSTLVGCSDALRTQSADLNFPDGFSIEGGQDHPTLVAGSVRVALTPGPVGTGEPVPAGRWVASSVINATGTFGLGVGSARAVTSSSSGDGPVTPTYTLDVAPDSAAVLHTGCRDLALQLSTSPPTAAAAPPSSCAPGDPGAAVDVWLAAVVADRFEVAVRDSTLTLFGADRGVELRRG